MRLLKLFPAIILTLLLISGKPTSAEPPPPGPTMFVEKTAEAGITQTHTAGVGDPWKGETAAWPSILGWERPKLSR